MYNTTAYNNIASLQQQLGQAFISHIAEVQPHYTFCQAVVPEHYSGARP